MVSFIAILDIETTLNEPDELAVRRRKTTSEAIGGHR
jgi:hypothetical protein